MPFLDLDAHLDAMLSIPSALSDEAGIMEAQFAYRARRADRRRHGRRPGGAKTAPAIVEAVILALSTSETYPSIARRFGISEPTVQRIARKARHESLMVRCAATGCHSIFRRRVWRGPSTNLYCSRPCKARAWQEKKRRGAGRPLLVDLKRVHALRVKSLMAARRSGSSVRELAATEGVTPTRIRQLLLRFDEASA